LGKDDINSTNDKGLSPLFVASFFGFADCIRVLSGTKERGEGVEFNSITELGTNVEATDMSGNTALHYAAWKGSPEAIRILVELGASVDTASHVGHLPLNYSGHNPSSTQASPHSFLTHFYSFWLFVPLTPLTNN
jgi:ankyrin repeat protein